MIEARSASVQQNNDPDVAHMVRAFARPATRGDLFRLVLDMQAVVESLVQFETAFLRRDSDSVRAASVSAERALGMQRQRIEEALEEWKNSVP